MGAGRAFGVGRRRPRTVRVHHDDVAAVRALTETVGAGVKIQGDSSLAPGDVMIDGNGNNTMPAFPRGWKRWIALFTEWRMRTHEFRQI
jgi:hypothetical protein